jgi:hypothetical protein
VNQIGAMQIAAGLAQFVGRSLSFSSSIPK